MNVSSEDTTFIVELVKQSPDIARYESATVGAALAGICRGAFAELSIFSSVWLTNVSHREILRLATVNPHLVCHVDKYSPRRNFERDGRPMLCHAKIHDGGRGLRNPNFVELLSRFYTWFCLLEKPFSALHTWDTLLTKRYSLLDKRWLFYKPHIIIYNLSIFYKNFFICNVWRNTL